MWFYLPTMMWHSTSLQNKYNFCLFLKGLSPREKFMTRINSKVIHLWTNIYLPLLNSFFSLLSKTSKLILSARMVFVAQYKHLIFITLIALWGLLYFYDLNKTCPNKDKTLELLSVFRCVISLILFDFIDVTQ